jgi:hypothetical protein
VVPETEHMMVNKPKVNTLFEESPSLAEEELFQKIKKFQQNTKKNPKKITENIKKSTEISKGNRILNQDDIYIED